MCLKSSKSHLASTIAVLSIFHLISCASIEIFKENVEVKKTKQYQSYLIINKELGRKGFQDDFLDAIVQDQIQRHLEENGLIYEKENPDVLIRYTSNQDPRQKEVYNNRYPMWGNRMWWDPWVYNPAMMNRQTMSSSTQNYELLQVIVDFIDPNSDKRIMTLTAVSESSNPKQRKNLVAKSTEKIIITYLKNVQSN